MKTALVTTTINVPTVLDLYRKLGPHVAFFCMGDVKTPDFFAAPGLHYYDVGAQKALDYACSELIGWNTIRRRNIAVLEALKWGADVIVTIDDDNLPMGPNYFWHMADSRGTDDYALQVRSENGWFDPGALSIPKTKQRGFPHAKAATDFTVGSTVAARVGVVSGLILGDPDIDACTRMEHRPQVHTASELARSGVVTNPIDTWTIFNTQNTSYLRELAPAMFCARGLGRHDDIFASLITQRVMCELGMHVHLGQPFVWQQRNPHDLLKDMNEEILGMTHVVEFAEWLRTLQVRGTTVLDKVRDIYLKIAIAPTMSWYPPIAVEGAVAYLDDCQKVM